MGEMLSFGGGVNSVAMAILLIEQGWRGPIVFADPGAEDPDTYCYLSSFERDWLGRYGLCVSRISPATHPGLYAPSYRLGLLEKCRASSIVPLMLNRWCTSEYKRRPLHKWAREHGLEVQMIGISAEEAQRARHDKMGSIALEYPLIDRGVGRDECRAIIRAAGLPVPPKSGCWFCPFQSLDDWRRLYELRPDLFDLAVEMDNRAIERMKEHRPNPFPGQLAFKYGLPLQAIKDQWDAQLELPLMPERVYDWQMCECRL